MRKIGYSEELIDASTAHNETLDPVILEARQRFSSLEASLKIQTSEEARKVIEAGGLLIVGTERHESRRIDNQLRGRAGRQGDPGRTKFYLALDDELLRLFGGERANAVFSTFGVDENMEIQSKFLSSKIEDAQKKIEGINFSSRKHVLEYDDVMNVQRNLTYGQRRKVLDGDDIHDSYLKMVKNVAEKIVYSFALDDSIMQNEKLALSLKIQDVFGSLPVADYVRKHEDGTVDAGEIIEQLVDQSLAHLAQKEEKITKDVMREAERQILLFNVDQKWMDHIDAMDQLRYSIGMRSVGQKDPVVEYRIEGSEMFEEMNGAIQVDTVRLIMKANISAEQRIERKSAVKMLQEGHGDSVSTPSMPSSDKKQTVSSNVPVTNAPIKREACKKGRNDPCHCGSGKKFKNCCGKD
jgi:preprotein translocase subunit SecA